MDDIKDIQIKNASPETVVVRDEEKIKREVGFGNRLLKITSDRDPRRFSLPMLDIRKLPIDAVNMITKGNKEDVVTTEDVVKSNVDLILATTTSINEPQRPNGPGVREDSNSLRQIHSLLLDGYKKVVETGQESPQIVIDSVRQTIARNRGIPVDKVEAMTTDSAAAWVADQFGKSKQYVERQIRATESVYR